MPRAIGVVLAALTPGLLVASLVHGLRGHDHPSLAGLIGAGLALLVAAVNVYLSFVRGALNVWRAGSRAGYRHISGFPVVGTLLATIAPLASFGAVLPAALALVAVVADTGGLPWFVIATRRDDSLWRRR